jgi:hypothetical protein
MRPPSGSGVSAPMPASRSARLLATRRVAHAREVHRPVRGRRASSSWRVG